MHKKTPLLLLAFAILFGFTGCAMDAQARRERAYRHYVAKQMKQRNKAIARAQKERNREMKRKTKNLQPSEPMMTTTLGDTSPQAAPISEATSATAPAYSEPVADPITVSASGSMPSEPSQP